MACLATFHYSGYIALCSCHQGSQDFESFLMLYQRRKTVYRMGKSRSEDECITDVLQLLQVMHKYDRNLCSAHTTRSQTAAAIKFNVRRWQPRQVTPIPAVTLNTRSLPFPNGFVLFHLEYVSIVCRTYSVKWLSNCFKIEYCRQKSRNGGPSRIDRNG